jgi:hypothetical protein
LVALSFTEGTIAVNVTVAGLPLVIALPFTVAVIPTFPAVVLVNDIIAFPFESVVTVVLPIKVPAPLAIVKTTVAPLTGLPLASVI